MSKLNRQATFIAPNRQNIIKTPSNLNEKELNDAQPVSSLEAPFWLTFKLPPPIILYCVFLGAFIGYMNLSLLWLGVIIYILTSFVYGEIDRLKRVLKKEAYKENAQMLLASQSESVEWLNHIIARIWLVLEPDVSKSLKNSIELVLASSKPGFLESLKMPLFTIGSTAPVFSNAKVYPSLEQDLINLDLDFNFEPEMSEDEGTKGLKIHIVAKMAKIDMPISVKDVHLQAKTRLQLKLVPYYPYIKVLDFCFLNPPLIQYILKPLIPVNVMDVPLLKDFLDNITQNALSGFVSPNQFTLDIEELMTTDAHSKVSLGVARIKIKQARDLPNMESLSNFLNTSNVTDGFVKIFLNGNVVQQTRVMDDSLNPVWNETFYVPIPKFEDVLSFQIYHESQIGHQFIGQFSTKVSAEDKVDGWFDLKSKTGDKKVKGQIRLQIDFYNRIDDTILDVIESATKETLADSTPPETLTRGILSFNIIEAKDVSIFPGVCPEVIGYINGKKVFSTTCKKNTVKPNWSEYKEAYIEHFDKDVCELVLLDTRLGSKLGSISFPIKSIKSLDSQASDWYDMGDDSVENSRFLTSTIPRLRFNTKFYPVDVHTSSNSIPNVPGILEIILVKASNLVSINRDSTSDPFFIVEVNGKEIYKTKPFTKQLNVNLKKEPPLGILLNTEDLDSLLIEIKDKENIGKDKKMGTAFYDLSRLITVDSDNKVKCLYDKEYATVTLDVTLKGEKAGTMEVQVKFITISGTKDHSLRLTRDGNRITLNDSLGFQTKSLFILSEQIVDDSKRLLNQLTSIPGVSSAKIFSEKLIKRTKTKAVFNELSSKGIQGTLVIELLKAKNLSAVNVSDESSDPFVNVDLGEERIYKSATYSSNLNPDFSNEKVINHPITLQSLFDNSKLSFTVKDYNKILSNKLIGIAVLNCKSLLEFKPWTMEENSSFVLETGGQRSVLTGVKPFAGPIKIMNDKRERGELFVSVSCSFDDFTPTMTPLVGTPVDLASSLKTLDVQVDVDLMAIFEKLNTIPDEELKVKTEYYAQVQDSQGNVFYKSAPMDTKGHFSELLPLQISFMLRTVVEDAEQDLKIVFRNAANDVFKEFPLVFVVKKGKLAQRNIALAEWLQARLTLEGKKSESLYSLMDNASITTSNMDEESSTKPFKKKSGFLSFGSTKKRH